MDYLQYKNKKRLAVSSFQQPFKSIPEATRNAAKFMPRYAKLIELDITGYYIARNIDPNKILDYRYWNQFIKEYGIKKLV